MACGAVIVAPRARGRGRELARHLHEGVDLGGDAAEGAVQAVAQVGQRPADERRAPGAALHVELAAGPHLGAVDVAVDAHRAGRGELAPGGTWPPMRSEPRTAPSASPRSSCIRPTVTPSAQSDGTPSRDARTSTRPAGRWRAMAPSPTWSAARCVPAPRRVPASTSAGGARVTAAVQAMGERLTPGSSARS